MELLGKPTETPESVRPEGRAWDLLTLILLTWRIWWAPNNASKRQMGFNSAFKGLNTSRRANLCVGTFTNVDNLKHPPSGYTDSQQNYDLITWFQSTTKGT